MFVNMPHMHPTTMTPVHKTVGTKAAPFAVRANYSLNATEASIRPYLKVQDIAAARAKERSDPNLRKTGR